MLIFRKLSSVDHVDYILKICSQHVYLKTITRSGTSTPKAAFTESFDVCITSVGSFTEC